MYYLHPLRRELLLLDQRGDLLGELDPGVRRGVQVVVHRRDGVLLVPRAHAPDVRLHEAGARARFERCESLWKSKEGARGRGTRSKFVERVQQA